MGGLRLPDAWEWGGLTLDGLELALSLIHI